MGCIVSAVCWRGERQFGPYRIPTKVRAGWHLRGDEFAHGGEFFRAEVLAEQSSNSREVASRTGLGEGGRPGPVLWTWGETGAC